MAFYKISAVLFAWTLIASEAYAFDADKLTQPTDSQVTEALSTLIYDINSRIKSRSDRLWRKGFRGAERDKTETSIRYWLTFHEKTQSEIFKKYQVLPSLSKKKQVEAFLKIRKNKLESYPLTEDQISTIYGVSASDYYQEVNPVLWSLDHVVQIETDVSPWRLSNESTEIIKMHEDGDYIFSEIKEVPPVLEALSRREATTSRALYHGGRVRLSDLKKWQKSPNDIDTYKNKVFASYSLDPSIGVHFISDTEKEDWVPALFVRRTTNGPIKTISEWSEYPEEMEILRLPEEFKVVEVRFLNDVCAQVRRDSKTKRDVALIYADDLSAPKTQLKNTTLIEKDICTLYESKN